MVTQLQASVESVRDFLVRFFDHIDPESGPVKGKGLPQYPPNMMIFLLIVKWP